MKSLLVAAVLPSPVRAAPPAQQRPPAYAPPAVSAGVLRGVDFAAARPLDEAYRAEFDDCDRRNVFKGVAMTGFRRCSNDPNRVRALLKFPDGTIFFESKMGLDIDGSRKACTDPGLADLCATWFRWPGLRGNARFVDSDKFPYVVIPIAGLRGRAEREFRDKTGADQGDLGVVVFRDKVVPVFVADGGPHNKLGEGSAALFREVEKILAHYGSVAEVRKARMHLYAGCFEFRKIGGSNRLSTHAWGVSIDLDSENNPQGKAYDESKGMMPMAVVKIFEAEGWKWGGRFKGKRVDCMHFEATS